MSSVAAGPTDISNTLFRLRIYNNFYLRREDSRLQLNGSAREMYGHNENSFFFLGYELKEKLNIRYNK